jgi:aspartate/methionine/tyrosine aminotransferase
VAEGAIRDRIRANLLVLRRELADSPASLLDVEGGWYATLRFPRIRSEQDWVLGLLREDDVYVHPGHFFDFEDEPYAVVSLLTREETLREGAQRISAHVRHAAAG